DTIMTTLLQALTAPRPRFIALVLLAGVAGGSLRAVELKVSRDALERTLRQQLFGGPNGRYYLKGNARSACYVYGDDPHMSFVAGRILVRMKAHAKLGKAVAGACLGI